MKPISLSDDKVQPAYMKEIEELEKDITLLKEKNKVLDDKINDPVPNQKFIDLLKKQKFANNKFLMLIDQKISYLKIKAYNRQKYVADNQNKLKIEDLDRHYEEYLTDLRVNAPIYPWRKTVSAVEKHLAKDAKPADAKGAPAEGHGGGGGHH